MPSGVYTKTKEHKKKLSIANTKHFEPNYWKNHYKKYYQEHGKVMRQNNRERWKVNSGRYNRMQNSHRIKLIKLLGGKCFNIKCYISGGCMDIRCLQLDHIKGNGSIERNKMFKTPLTMYRYYLNHLEEAKLKLQVLCANCNWIKRYENNEERGGG